MAWLRYVDERSLHPVADLGEIDLDRRVLGGDFHHCGLGGESMSAVVYEPWVARYEGHARGKIVAATSKDDALKRAEAYRNDFGGASVVHVWPLHAPEPKREGK